MYCILLKDGNYLFGFNPATGHITTTHLNSLALPFDRTSDAMKFLDTYSRPLDALAFHLIQGIRPLIGAPVIESA